MRAILEIPDSLYEKLKERSVSEGTTVEQLILDVLEKEFNDEVRPDPPRPIGKRRAKFPIIPSDWPGTMDLSNFDFDDLLT